MNEQQTSPTREPWNGADAEFWAGTASGIAKGISAFPILLASYVRLRAWISNSVFDPVGYLVTAVGALIFAFVIHFFALVLASVYGIACDKALNIWQTNSRKLWLGAFVGGLVAITFTIPFVLAVLIETQSFELNENNLRVITFAVLAIFLGQLGAIFGGRKRLESKLSQEDWIAGLPRFSIATLMWLSLGICVMLGALKYYRLDALLAYAVVCLVAQLTTLTLLLLGERFYSQSTK
jgi:hypothetical protein